MAILTVKLRDGLFSALRHSAAEFPGDLRLAAALACYEGVNLSHAVAADMAGLCRTDFLLALARPGRNSFQVDLDDLDRELARG